MFQMKYLDEWALLEKEQSDSLVGAVEALKSSTLRVPVTEGAKVCMFIYPQKMSEIICQLKR